MIRRVLTAVLPEPGCSVALSKNEAHHLIKVLRLKNGAQVEAIDGSGKIQKAYLRYTDHKVYLEAAPEEFLSQTVPEKCHITLCICILKSASFSWLIQKASELGVNTIIPLESSYTVVRPDAQSIVRWQKIADQSLKQSKRLERLQIEPIQKLEHFFLQAPQKMLWCDITQKKSEHLFLGTIIEKSTESDFCILIGPEGGFNTIEQKYLTKKFQSVHLGSYTLRAETAAIFSISTIKAIYKIKEFRQNSLIKGNAQCD